VPAYYDEVDYCMRLRDAGYRVVYEPSAVVDHYEFGSEAKQDDAISVSRHNRKRFPARYSGKLLLDYFPPADRNILAARERLSVAKKRLLMIDNEVPLRALGSGYPRARAILIEAAQAGRSVPYSQCTKSRCNGRKRVPSSLRKLRLSRVKARLHWSISSKGGAETTTL
jgi:hypothetical protein